MKKTLLALVLAGLATSSFATQKLLYTDNSYVGVNGNLKYVLNYDSSNGYDASGTRLSHLTDVSNQLKFYGDLRGKFVFPQGTAGFKFGYFKSVGSTHTTLDNYYTDSTKATTYGRVEERDYLKSHVTSRFRNVSGYVYADFKDYGKVTVGVHGLSGAAFDAVPGGSNFAVASMVTAYNYASLSQTKGVKYDSLDYNGFTFAVSYGDTKTGSNTAFDRNYEGAVAYQLTPKTSLNASVVLANETDNNEAVVQDNAGLDLFVYTGTDKVDLQLEAGVATRHDRVLNVHTRDYVTGVDVAYNGFDRVSPYGGVGFVYEVQKPTERALVTRHTTTNLYLGTTGTLYKLAHSSVSAGAEVGLQVVKNVTFDKYVANFQGQTYLKYSF